MPITHKQRLFAQAFAQHGNATQAAVEAGYAEPSAAQTGARLLRNDKVQAEIRGIAESTRQDAILTAEECAIILSQIARPTLSDFLEADGTLRPDAFNDPQLVRCLRHVRIVEQTDPAGNTTRRTEITLEDRVRAIERLCRMRGYDQTDKAAEGVWDRLRESLIPMGEG